MLRDRLLEQRAKGVTVAQMHGVLKERGIEIGERSLKVFLDKGELPGRKAAANVAQAAAPEGMPIRSKDIWEDCIAARSARDAEA